MKSRILAGAVACLLTAFTMLPGFADDETIVLVHGTLIDGTGGPPLQDAVVIIKAGRIESVGIGSNAKIPEGATVLEALGATILPGFINSHVHGAYNGYSLGKWAEAGVTTVRDLAAYMGKSSYSLRDVFNQHAKNARLVAGGPQMTAVHGFVPPGYTASVFIGSPEDGVREGHRILDEGADALKVMMESNWDNPPMGVEAARAIIDTAHAHGKKAPVHVSLCRDADRALQAGADSLAHMVIDELSPELAGRISAAGVIWIPTIELWKGTGDGAFVVSNLHTFVSAGGAVALGTDFGGASHSFDLGMPMKEIGWMREAGMTPMQIIVAATRNGAKACGIDGDTGTVEAGKAADILVVDGDPLSNLDVLKLVRWVIHAGTIIVRP